MYESYSNNFPINGLTNCLQLFPLQMMLQSISLNIYLYTHFYFYSVNTEKQKDYGSKTLKSTNLKLLSIEKEKVGYCQCSVMINLQLLLITYCLPSTMRGTSGEHSEEQNKFPAKRSISHCHHLLQKRCLRLAAHTNAYM